jgi:L-ascorbate metabolism protein UlaG (beta-lactamase superfamily)
LRWPNLTYEGYCSVDDNDSHSIEPDLPTCPAFKEIGERFGGFDLGLIPIGAYAPRSFMSPIHNAPIDSVRMFKDIVSDALAKRMLQLTLQRNARKHWEYTGGQHRLHWPLVSADMTRQYLETDV